MSKVDRLRAVMEEIRAFRLCGPSDDPDQQTGVTVGYNYLLVRLQKAAKGLVPAGLQSELDGIKVERDNLYSVFDARAHVDALIPDIEDFLDSEPQVPLSLGESVLGGLRRLLHAKERDDLVALLSRTTLDFDVSSSYGSHWNSYAAEALFYAPIEDCEVLRELPTEDVGLIIALIQEISPPREGDMDVSSVNFLVDPERLTLLELNDSGWSTGWDRVDRTLAGVRERLRTAGSEEQYQAVGHGCRETLISLAQAVYDPQLHVPTDGIAPSETDAKRMLDAYMECELAGSTNKEARKHAKAALDLANKLQHDRTATFREAMLCAEATTSVVNIVAILSGKRDRPQ